jgi:hypothetical protein
MKGSVKRSAGHGRNRAAEKLNGGRFAESAGFALKGYARGLAIGCAHKLALSCNKGRKTRSGVSSTSKKKFGVTP